jgi:geranylgeranyl pyrophosphate synthase
MQDRYQHILDIAREEIEQVLEKMREDIQPQEPLKSKVFTFLNAPSKHIRPLVAILYLKSIGQEINQNQILYQSAVELVHNASLIHDDVIDESLKRRGNTTLNVDFGNKLAVICGDYLLSVALNKVLKIGDIRLVEMFSDTLNVMSNGEIFQQFNKFKIPTLEDYIKKSEQKTAKLFETAVLGGLMISDFQNTNLSQQNALEFARSFGIAFQIRDDLINCETINTDIKDGIYTAPVIFSGGTNITKNGIEKTQSLLNNYIKIALDNIANIEDNKYKQALVELLGLMKYE